MKSRLSAMKYIKNNKKICGVLISSLAMTFMVMYIVAFVLYVNVESAKTSIISQRENIIYVDLSMETLGVNRDDYEEGREGFIKFTEDLTAAKEELAHKLEAIDGIDKVYPYEQVLNVNYEALIGETGYIFPLVAPEKVPEILEHSGAELIDGRLPEAEGEIVADEAIMKNQSIKIGDYFMSDTFGRGFKVVGVVKSDNLTVVGTPTGTNCGYYTIILCNKDTASFYELAEKIGLKCSEKDDIDDLTESRRFYEDEVEGDMVPVIKGIILVVVVFLAISLIIAYISFLRNRVNEYCLYISLGYSRKDVYMMIMKELLFMIVAGVIIGFFITLGVMKIFDVTMIHPSGLKSKWLLTEQLEFIFAALIVIIGILQIPVILAINKIKTIDMMED